MKTINCTRAFDVIVAREGKGNVLVKVPQGVSNQENDVADHWYTKVHLAGGGIGSPEYAGACRVQADAAFLTARDTMASYAQLEAAAHEAEVAAGQEPAEPASARLALPDESPAEPKAPKVPRKTAAEKAADKAAAEAAKIEPALVVTEPSAELPAAVEPVAAPGEDAHEAEVAATPSDETPAVE